MSKLDQIIASIIDDTPAGEISNVINDLKLIVDKNISSELEESITNYNINKFISVPTSKKNSIILSKYNQQEDGSFIDSAKGIKVTVDHLKRLVIDEETIEIDEELSSIYKELQEYIDTKYPNQVEIGVYSNGSIINIIIVGERQNPANYWNGRWVSHYEYSNKELKGDIKIDVHYYEDGNVRLTNTKKLDSIGNVTNLIQTIDKIEDDLQTDLNRSFLTLNESSFKNLRRKLPVTRSKINWGKSIGTYRLGKDIANE